MAVSTRLRVCLAGGDGGIGAGRADREDHDGREDRQDDDDDEELDERKPALIPLLLQSSQTCIASPFREILPPDMGLDDERESNWGSECSAMSDTSSPTDPEE